MTVLKISDTSTRGEIEQAITALKAKYDRLPAHYTRQRDPIMDEIETLVDQWIAAEAE